MRAVWQPAAAGRTLLRRLDALSGAEQGLGSEDGFAAGQG